MRSVHHVGITVSDLDRSIAFYHDLLGLPFVVPPTPWFEGDDLARGLGVEPPVALRVALFQVGEGETWFEILEYRSPATTTERALPQSDVGAGHVAFHVTDIERAYDALKDRGVEFNSEPNTVDDGPLAGWRWVYFKDPDGHTMELVEVAYVRQQARDADIASYLTSRATSSPDT